MSMANTTDSKHKDDLLDLVTSVGVGLQPAGRERFRGLCPFHPDRTPSFFVYPDRGYWRCFGCGERGDAIDFTRRYHGVGFTEALRILGCAIPTRQDVESARKKRNLRIDAQWRESDLAWALGNMVRRCKDILDTITPETLDRYAIVLQELEILIYQHNILLEGAPEDRAKLVAELRDLPLLERRLLWNRNFDYLGWLRTTLRGRP